MQLETTIAAAIARSEALNEISKLEIDGDSGDALAAIRTIVGTCKFDYDCFDDEGNRLYVWGFDEARETLWRLEITFADSDDDSDDE